MQSAFTIDALSGIRRQIRDSKEEVLRKHAASRGNREGYSIEDVLYILNHLEEVCLAGLQPDDKLSHTVYIEIQTEDRKQSLPLLDEAVRFIHEGRTSANTSTPQGRYKMSASGIVIVPA